MLHKKEISSWKKVSLSDYQYIVNELFSSLEVPCVLFLTGEVGMGKTTFARIFTQSEANSPTYSLVQEYDDVLHADFYRIKDASEIFDLDLSSYLEGKNYFLAEWGEQFFNTIIKFVRDDFHFYVLNFSACSDDLRNLSLEEIDPLLS